MTVVIFTPTRLFGGIDIAYNSLMRQGRSDLHWLIADQLLEERDDVWFHLSLEAPFPVEAFTVPIEEGNFRSLAASYNVALEKARDMEADLFVSMQDYFWIPDDGIKRFEEMQERCPGDLYTGLASLSADPHADKVVNRKHPISIFEKAYTECPQEILWNDVRGQEVPTKEYWNFPCPPEFWETNWAAISKEILETDLTFNEEYDRGVAWENVDFAKRALNEYGAIVRLDPYNHALGLPHRAYFPEIFEDEKEHNNMRWHQESYGL